MGNRSTKAQWSNGAIFLVAAIALFVLNGGAGFGGLVAPLVLVAVAAAATPLFKRKSVTRAEALASGADVVIYHRPGCSFCIRMKTVLGAAGKQATWVDIWDDEEAAAFVRSANNGNETVPTVVIGGKAHTNPEPSLVRAHLA